MGANRLAHLMRITAAGSRRGVLRAISSLSLALPLLGLTGIAAKKKKKKKKKKKPPPLVLTYTCPGPPQDVLTWQTVQRVAQVFVASRSGTLRRIQFHIDKNPGSAGDYAVQLLRVDDGTPQASALSILAATTIANGAVPDGESILTANFIGPHLEAGTEYAAVVGRLQSAIELGQHSDTGNVCAGETFSSQGGAFVASADIDLVASVFVD
jgi:hypothetical protein